MSIAVYEEMLKGIAYQTFEITCYMFPLEEWEMEERGVMELGDDSIGTVVRFDGAVEGGMKVRVSPDLFDAIAENMLGMEEGDRKIKEDALCEIANIICGNTVPIFAKGDKICYIRPPKIVDDQNVTDEQFDAMENETVMVHLDEGVAEINIYYSAG